MQNKSRGAVVRYRCGPSSDPIVTLERKIISIRHRGDADRRWGDWSGLVEGA